jgi:hypothetical protein
MLQRRKDAVQDSQMARGGREVHKVETNTVYIDTDGLRRETPVLGTQENFEPTKVGMRK